MSIGVGVNIQILEERARSAVQALAEAENLVLILGIVSGGVGLLYGVARLAAFLKDRKWRIKARSVKQQLAKSNTTSHFTEEEIQSALAKYVVPDCARDDPAAIGDYRYVSDIRETVFKTVDRFFSEHSDKRHLLILADSGMGKTTFCLNYYNRLLKAGTGKDCALVSLSRTDASEKIRHIKNKRNCILILDALDEDIQAQSDAAQRLASLLTASADFSAVIITCRSHFFPDEQSIPYDTRLAKIAPRKGGEPPTYKMHRLYLMPFDEDQVQQYIDINFNIFRLDQWTKRSEARRVVARVPELAVRPMLLELLPDLVREKKTITELYDLYDYLVLKWLERESRWISTKKLLMISEKLALRIFEELCETGNDRISPAELVDVAGKGWDPKDDISFVRTRSLLNRDGEGQVKFAHRSILEFLVVRAAVRGNDMCFSYRWTDFMRQLLVSWGYTEEGLANTDRARAMLAMDLERAGLIPLSDPPRKPGHLKGSEFSTLASRRKGFNKTKRPVPKAWKAGVLLLRPRDRMLYLHDMEYDIRWKLPDWAEVIEHREVSAMRLTLPQVAAQFGPASAYRLPSYEEFISLLECEAALNVELLSEGEFYWIADQLGPKQNLVVSVSETDRFREKMEKIYGPRAIEGTKRKLSVFEISVFVEPRQLSNFKAVCLAIEEGTSGLLPSRAR